jgi:hypothetical protein
MKTIRLLAPIRVGHQIHPNNAVFDASDEVAEKLLGADPPCAEETDAIERYPIDQPLTRVDDFPVWGTEKFPRDTNLVPPPPPSAFTNDIDRHVQGNIRNGAGPAAPAGSKEPAPARIEVTKDMERAGEEEAAAAARAAPAIPVVVVDDDKGSKGKAK